MKKLAILLPLIFAFLISSCKKQSVKPGNATTATQPILYLILDKNGNSLLTSKAHAPDDSVTVVYNNNGENGQLYDRILDLQAIKTLNPSLLSLYPTGGIVASFSMIGLSNGIGLPNPINTFQINYKGQNLGTFYFEYLSKYPYLHEGKVFTYNNVPVQLDSTANGIHYYVIQSQLEAQ